MLRLKIWRLTPAPAMSRSASLSRSATTSWSAAPSVNSSVGAGSNVPPVLPQKIEIVPPLKASPSTASGKVSPSMSATITSPGSEFMSNGLPATGLNAKSAPTAGAGAARAAAAISQAIRAGRIGRQYARGDRHVNTQIRVLRRRAGASWPRRRPRRACRTGFVGTMLDGPAATFDRDRLAHELDAMRASGVETVRVTWSWRDTQPYASWAAVPEAERARFRDVDGLPLSVARLDALVELAARRGLRVLPVTVYTPVWDVQRIGVLGSPPRSTRPYADFMRALVRRYGHRGAFWREHPRLPPPAGPLVAAVERAAPPAVLDRAVLVVGVRRAAARRRPRRAPRRPAGEGGHGRHHLRPPAAVGPHRPAPRRGPRARGRHGGGARVHEHAAQGRAGRAAGAADAARLRARPHADRADRVELALLGRAPRRSGRGVVGDDRARPGPARRPDPPAARP